MSDQPTGSDDDGHGPPLLLRAEGSEAAIYPQVGGRLGQLDLGAGPLLRGPGPGLDWSQWGAFPLVPWSNRIPGGHLQLDDIDAVLPVNFPDGSAIHGLTAACPWTVVASTDRRADLEVRVAEGPYRVLGTQSFSLEPGRLRLRLAATNEGDEVVPVGIGIHPWFRAGAIEVAANARWPGEPLPTGPPVAATGAYDLRREVVPAPMDACFTSLTSPVALVPGARFGWEGPITHVVVYSQVPGWLGVEPVTMANNGFELARQRIDGHGVRMLGPGATLEVTYRLERVDAA